MGMVLWEPKVIYSKSERRNGGGERVCCSGEEENAEEETGIGWDTPAGASLIKLLMEHQFPEQDSPWLGNESEEESGGSTKMMENSSGMDWLDLMVGEAAEEPGSRNLNLFAVAQDMNVIVQQRQNDNIFLQHAAACMAPSTPTPEPPQSASLAFSKLLGLQDLPSSSHQIAPAHLNPWPNSSLHLNPSSGPTQFIDSKNIQFIDSKNLHFQFHSPLYDFRSHPPSPFLHHSSQFKPSSPLIKMQQQSASDSREPGRKRARITPSVSSIPGIRRSSNSDPSKPKRNGSRNPACHALNTNLKPRAKQGCANDPQSIAARQRRERISERLKILQDLIPNGSKVDLVTMLEKAINYVKFLQLQVKVLMNDEFWATQQEQENPDQPSSDITSSHEYNGSM